MQLTDYSSLRAAPDEKVTIPLNGVNYHAIAEIAADTVLDAAAGSSDIPELAEGMTLEQAEADPALAAKLNRAGSSNLARALDFMREVLEPDSWAQWKANMAPPAKGLTPAKRRDHLARMITLPQLLAVFRELVKHYTGRPTPPSSSSPNGGGGTGGTSTAGVPAEA